MKLAAAVAAALVSFALGGACTSREPEQLPDADAGSKTGCLDGRTGAQGACEDAGVDAPDGD